MYTIKIKESHSNHNVYYCMGDYDASTGYLIMSNVWNYGIRYPKIILAEFPELANYETKPALINMNPIHISIASVRELMNWYSCGTEEVMNVLTAYGIHKIPSERERFEFFKSIAAYPVEYDTTKGNNNLVVMPYDGVKVGCSNPIETFEKNPLLFKQVDPETVWSEFV